MRRDRAQLALCSARAHDRVIVHILSVGFFFVGFSIFVFFFVAANASSELTTGMITAAPNAASTLAMSSFLTLDLHCFSTAGPSNTVDSPSNQGDC
jgi:hypothetical protein